MSSSISRRDFLKGSLAAAGLTIAASITPFGTKLLNGKEIGKAAFQPNAFFQITPDDLVTIYIPNSEMGQGVRTALSMIVADELEADWKKVRVKQAAAGDLFKSPILGDQLTVGSASVRGFYEPLRKAGAAGRAMLVKAAAETWKVPETECEAFNGVVKHKKTSRSLTYGKLCERASGLTVPQDPALKKEAEFRYMGKPVPRLDIPDKVAGTAVFGIDISVPNMLYAVVARPPAYGAKPVSFDEKAAGAVNDVKNVVPMPGGIAVIAGSLPAAWKGRDALQVKWGKGSHPDLNNASIEKHFMEGLDKPGAVARNTGDVKKALAEAQKKVEATYFVPYVAHATMEPMNCTAYVQKDRCDVWAPTQGQLIARMVASEVSGLPQDKVDVHTTLLGCGLGRRATPDFVAEAVGCSRASGKPVKVIWSREEDIKYDFFRAATCQRIQAGLDGQGQVVGWSQKVACPSLLKYIDPRGIKDGVDGMSLWGIIDDPQSPFLSNTAYDIPAFYVEQYLSDLPIPVNPWRAVQNGPNAFVMECFMDELARAAGKDPVAFRMELLKNNPRARRVLSTAAQKGGWGKAPPQGMGRGIAQHACFGTCAAMVADVSVDEKTGKVRAHKVVVAIDCGPVVNPDTVVAQIEGGVIEALSTALMEQVIFADGGVKSANFGDYKLITMRDVPEIEVHVISSTEKIGGIGELGVPPLAPAVATAFFNLTGVRIRRIPLDRATVMEALKKKGA